jgi:hypothetical protein
MNLAEQIPGTNIYKLDPKWKRVLEYNGRKDDVIKTIYNDLTPEMKKRWHTVDPSHHLSIYRNTWTIEGKVVSKGIADEMTARPYVLVENAKGRQFFFSSSKLQASDLKVGQQVKIDHGKFRFFVKEKDLQTELHGPSVTEGKEKAPSFKKEHEKTKEKVREKPSTEKDRGLEL